MRKIGRLIYVISKLPNRFFSKISIFAFVYLSEIDSTSAILRWSRVYWSTIHRFTYVSDHCWIIKAEIGSFCSIASNVWIGGGKHPLNFVSTSPVFYSENNILKKCFNRIDFQEYEKTTIGNDVWIGSNVFIKGGVSVGHGAVIGAHSVVTKDVEPYSIVAGNPAKLIRKRFDDLTVQKLIKSQWWNFPDKILNERAANFHDVSKFLDFLTDEKEKWID